MPVRSSRPLPDHLQAEVAALEAMPSSANKDDDSPPIAAWDGAMRGRFAQAAAAGRHPRLKLPVEVATIFEAVKALEARYDRKFTVDGHLLGSIGEVVAKEALGIALYPMGHPNHDAYDDAGDVQVKMTAGKSIAMYGPSVRLVVLRVISNSEAEIFYDGPGELPWTNAGKEGKNGQRVISLTKLNALSAQPHRQ